MAGWGLSPTTRVNADMAAAAASSATLLPSDFRCARAPISRLHARPRANLFPLPCGAGYAPACDDRSCANLLSAWLLPLEE